MRLMCVQSKPALWFVFVGIYIIHPNSETVRTLCEMLIKPEPHQHLLSAVADHQQIRG